MDLHALGVGKSNEKKYNRFAQRAISTIFAAPLFFWRWEPARPDPDGLKIDYPMTAQPKGLRTAEIAAAAKAALKQLGEEALPDVLNAAARRGRSLAFFHITSIPKVK